MLLRNEKKYRIVENDTWILKHCKIYSVSIFLISIVLPVCVEMVWYEIGNFLVIPHYSWYECFKLICFSIAFHNVNIHNMNDVLITYMHISTQCMMLIVKVMKFWKLLFIHTDTHNIVLHIRVVICAYRSSCTAGVVKLQ